MFDLRFYQEEMKVAVYSEWDRVQSTAVIAATGTGKTELYLSIATELPGRVLVIAHRDYLLGQPIRRLKLHGFEDVDIEKANERSEGKLQQAKIVFASVQSLSRASRLATFDPFKFDAVIIDEAHRAVAKSYRTIIDHFKLNARLRMLLLTATPKRKDGIALGNVCDSVAYVYGPKQAIHDGWIVPLRFFRRTVEGLDFSAVKLKGADLDQDQVEKLLIQEKPLHAVCASLAEDRGPTVIFCPGVMVARAYATLMNDRYRPNRSAVLWQDSSEEERELVGKKLASGDLDYLFNCDIATEGYDVPELVRVVWAAPTASLVRFTQGTGRAFRTHSSLRNVLSGGREESATRRLQIQQSPKPFAEVVTYYPQNCKHQLCEPNDILGGEELDPEVKAFAKQVQEQTASQSSGSDPDEDIETAETIVELRGLLDQRRKKIRAEAKVRDDEYDAFGGSRNRAKSDASKGERKTAKEVSTDWPRKADTKMISPGMKLWFKKNGCPQINDLDMTAWQAYIVRRLVEFGFKIDKALSFGLTQAKAALADVESKKGGSDDS